MSVNYPFTVCIKIIWPTDQLRLALCFRKANAMLKLIANRTKFNLNLGHDYAVIATADSVENPSQIPCLP